MLYVDNGGCRISVDVLLLQVVAVRDEEEEEGEVLFGAGRVYLVACQRVVRHGSGASCAWTMNCWKAIWTALRDFRWQFELASSFLCLFPGLHPCRVRCS